jgi:colicin import membrane protein
MSDSLSKPISLSLAAHCALIAIFFLKMTFFPAEPIQIKRALRVDLVALPEKVATPPAPAPAEEPKAVPAPPQEAPKPEVKTPAKPKPKAQKPKIDAKKLEKSQESAVNRLKAMEALEKLKSEQAEAQKKAQEFKGNQVSKGNSLTGLEQLEYDRYFDQVEQLVYSNWSLPEWLAQSELRAQAMVLVDASGNVTKKKILKSSGNEVFDAQVLASIDKSSPFPAPPARLQGVLANQGFIFNFPD